MKKIYESPAVEVTVLESKDSILSSVELSFEKFFTTSVAGDLVDAGNENLW